ncbi:sialidase family protein [Paenibacillus aurantius]|uniref:Sialidase family protein n=1 Tax=Paenibacillus aurantius TaxID=2918900 RepID=A0AA96LAA5_9BACL|nr:sialidase family protein [Paenibacillus aurantius]WNQ09573.1 sialidase family protein [Paenibacillus aurantius]
MGSCRSTRLIWSLCFVLALSVIAGPAASAAPDTLSISYGAEFAVEDGGTATRHLPFLSYVNNKAIVTFSQHPDSVLYPTTDGMRISSDGGATWPTYKQNTDFYLTSIIRLNNGDLMGTSYVTQRVDARNSTMFYWISSDSGTTWTKLTGNVNFPQDQAVNSANWGGFLFHRSILVMPDGSLQGTMYGKYTTDSKYRVLWVKSTDGGANWSVVSTVAYSTTVGNEGFCEPVAIRAADNSLLVVMRTGGTSGGVSYPLYQTRSTNDGLTWSTPVPLPGVDSADAYSVDPDLTMMTNGTLVLSFGRPTTKMLFSLDGSGQMWGAVQTGTFGSTASNYTGVREVSANKLLLISDNSTRTKIIGKYIDVVRSAIPMNGFESDTAGSAPIGFTVVGGNATVVGSPVYAGSKALRINDTSSSVLTNVVKTSTAKSFKTFEAMIRPVSSTNGNIISLNSGANDNAHSVFHVCITADGSVNWYNGSAWTNVAPAGSVTLGAWNKIKIEAVSTSRANLYINDVYKGRMGKWNSFATIDRVRFMSGSTTGTGDDYYVDNLYWD